MAYEDLINQYQDPDAMSQAFSSIKSGYANAMDPLLKKKQQQQLREQLMAGAQSARDKVMTNPTTMGSSARSQAGTGLLNSAADNMSSNMGGLVANQNEQQTKNAIGLASNLGNMSSQASSMGLSQAKMQAMLEEAQKQRIQDAINAALQRGWSEQDIATLAQNQQAQAKLVNSINKPSWFQRLMGGAGTAAQVAGTVAAVA